VEYAPRVQTNNESIDFMTVTFPVPAGLNMQLNLLGKVTAITVIISKQYANFE